MIEAPLYSAAGARQKAAFALPGDLFDGTVHEPALHQAVKTWLGNQRQGTAKTKTRGRNCTSGFGAPPLPPIWA